MKRTSLQQLDILVRMTVAESVGGWNSYGSTTPIVVKSWSGRNETISKGYAWCKKIDRLDVLVSG